MPASETPKRKERKDGVNLPKSPGELGRKLREFVSKSHN